MTIEERKRIGKRIKERLEALGMSQVKLADLVGVTDVSVSRYISGGRIPRAHILQKIADALQVTPEYLLSGKGAKTKNRECVIAIRTDLRRLPEQCDECRWFGTRPHPYKGWIDICELMSQCMDDDQPDEWIYDGDSRPKACPLIRTYVEVDEESEEDDDD